ncbi:unnamed protein product, partial [marine sediment metagenome]
MKNTEAWEKGVPIIGTDIGYTPLDLKRSAIRMAGLPIKRRRLEHGVT